MKYMEKTSSQSNNVNFVGMCVCALCVYIEDSCIKIIVLVNSCIKIIVLVRLIVKQCYFYCSLLLIAMQIPQLICLGYTITQYYSY